MNHQANLYWQNGERAAGKGEWAVAKGLFATALAADPGHVPSLLSLSTVHGRMGEHRAARQSALAAYHARPTLAPLIFGLAQRLRYFNEYEALVDCLGWPGFLNHAPPQALAEAAVALSTIGMNDKAVELVGRALRLDPRHAPSLYFRGNLHTFNGRFAEAALDYEASLKADPRLFQAAWMLSGLRKQTPESNHVERLKAQLESATPGRRGEAYVAYALHKELHDLGRYDEAWDALMRGCRVERKLVGYNATATSEMFNEIRKACTAGFIHDSSGITQEATPIFIVGMFRSGTSLLERMLSGHARVTDGGETMAFSEQLKWATGRATHGVLDAPLAACLANADYEEIARAYAKPLLWLAKGKPYVTEKLPANFLNIGFIAKAIPQARFLHLVRDPMDTCYANLRTLFSEVAAYSYDMGEMGQYFRWYRSLMRHWHEVMPGRVLDVRYDDLVQSPEAQMRRVAEYCGLSFEPGMLDLERSDGAVVTASAAQVRQGIVKDRGRAWLPYEAHLQPLVDALEDEV